MNVKFTIPGNPVAKGRPRFTQAKGFVRTYTPQKTANFENLVKVAYVQACHLPPTDRPVKAYITAFFPIPKTTLRKAERAKAVAMLLPMCKRPDIDNVVKAILDGLNGVAFVDDKQVCHIECSKWYSLHPRTEVSLSMFMEP